MLKHNKKRNIQKLKINNTKMKINMMKKNPNILMMKIATMKTLKNMKI